MTWFRSLFSGLTLELSGHHRLGALAGGGPLERKVRPFCADSLLLLWSVQQVGGEVCLHRHLSHCFSSSNRLVKCCENLFFGSALCIIPFHEVATPIRHRECPPLRVRLNELLGRAQDRFSGRVRAFDFTPAPPWHGGMHIHRGTGL